MKEYFFEGNKYYFTGKKWVDSSFLEVPTELLGKLNQLLREEIDFEHMSDRELLDFAGRIKDGENYQLAIKAMELLLERANLDIVRQILPRLTSSYRKIGKVEKALNLGEHYISVYAGKVKSPYLLTSMAAACCDLGDYSKARKYANQARAISGKEVSMELINVYARIKKYDGGATTKEDIEEAVARNEERKDKNTSDRIEDSKIGFKDSAEWAAMNRIWKAIPQQNREMYAKDFGLICKCLTTGELNSPQIIQEDDEEKIRLSNHRYLEGLSRETQEFFFFVLNMHGLNLYHSIMAFINVHPRYSEQELISYYMTGYREKRPYLEKYQKELEEMVHLCYERMVERGVILGKSK